jgi:hypothetical protein
MYDKIDYIKGAEINFMSPVAGDSIDFEWKK